MSRQRQAFIVSSGSYSDYSVWCVFEREEDAWAYAAKSMDLAVDEYRRRLKLPASDRDSLGGGATWVESFDFYGPGEVPTR